jgi:Fe-coproporphyrin III synthase
MSRLSESPVVSGGELTSRSASFESHIESLPILILNVHSRCNCRCVMCDIWKREENQEIKSEALERHRLSMRRLGVRRVVLTGGEPLLHSDLSSLCTFFHEQNIQLTLLTTGLLLQKRASTVAQYFDDVIVSLDGPSAIHNQVRRIEGAYQLIRDGIAAVRQLRSKMPIHGRTTVQRANHRHLAETVVAAQELGLDSISFLAADLTSEAFNRPLLWPIERQNQISLDRQEVSALEQEIEALIVLRSKMESSYILETPSKLRRIALHFRAHLEGTSEESPVCNAPWVSAVVEVDGSVRPCFFHARIGDINSSTLEEALNGEVAKQFRKTLDVANNPTCRRCVCSLNYSVHPKSGTAE